MKLAVILPTRNRPELCQAVVTAFRHLAGDDNEIQFFIRIDQDQTKLYQAIIGKDWHEIKEDVWLVIKPPPPTVAEKAMDILGCPAFKRFDPDIYVLMSDDVFPLSMHWDNIIVEVVKQGHDVFSWEETFDQVNPAYIVATRKYVQALPSYLPCWFPFWFVDLWRGEVHIMAFGERIPVVKDLKLGGHRTHTIGMRDVPFWFGFFAATRKERIKEAMYLASCYGKTPAVNPDMLMEFAKEDEAQKDRYALYERVRYDSASKPSPGYEIAMARALAYFKKEKTDGLVEISVDNLTLVK